MTNQVQFIAEVSSNHAQDIERSIEFIRVAAEAGCDAVKFQLFKIDELFAPEILSRSAEHRNRKQWELPKEFLPELSQTSRDLDIRFSCTPFYIEAVEELEPHVDFYKVASYELLWDDLLTECAQTKKPLVLSTGMANLNEISHAVDVFMEAGGEDLTLLHCVSGYPAPIESCNLSAIQTLRDRFGGKIGWSDHSRSVGIVQRAVERWGAEVIEFHLDLDEEGAEYTTGHCWLPGEIAPLINMVRHFNVADGNGVKEPTSAEIDDRPWRADPSDGLRPLLSVRREWAQK